jgi:hypothetical protein
MWNEHKARKAALAAFRESLAAHHPKDAATSVAFARYRHFVPSATDYEIRRSLAKGLAAERVTLRIGIWRTWLDRRKSA